MDFNTITTAITLIPSLLGTWDSTLRFIDGTRKVDKRINYYRSKIEVIRKDTRPLRTLCDQARQKSNIHSDVEREGWENLGSALDRVDCTLNELSNVLDEIQSGGIKLLRKSSVDRKADDINRCEQQLTDDGHSIERSLNVIRE